jgi:hypothetical protein
MASEILRSLKTGIIPENIKAVQEGIIEAALSQPPESIERAIRSFDWISQKDLQSEAQPSRTAEKSTPPAGFVTEPLDYLAMAQANQAPAGELVPLDELASALRSQEARNQKGLDSFLQTGIQESLRSFKLKPGAKGSPPEILEPLNDLLKADQIKNLNASRLQPSIDAVNELYSTLKKVQNGMTHLELNRLRMIRA